MNYVLLGNSHHRALDKKINHGYLLKEKVSIKFRSSLASLQEYFEKIFFIPIEVKSGDATLGSAVIKLNELVKTVNLKEFLEMHPSNNCDIEAVTDIKMELQELQLSAKQPILISKSTIEYVATKKLHQTELLENYKRLNEIDLMAGGDSVEIPTSVTVPSVVKSKSQSSRSSASKIVESVVEVQKEAEMIEAQSNGKSQSNEIPEIISTTIKQQANHSATLLHLFSYNLQLISMEFNRRPDNGIWHFKFYHDKADTPRTIINKEINEAGVTQNNAIVLENLKMQLYFTSRADNIMETIKSSDHCLIHVRGPRDVNLKARLDCKNLWSGNDQQSGSVLLQDQKNTVTAIANIVVRLDDLGINFNSQIGMMTAHSQESRQSEMKNDAATLYEDLSYKMIEELGEWKIHQKESFLAELKQKETQFMDRLKNRWNEKQAKLEEEIFLKSDKLGALTNSLSDAQKRLKEKEKLHEQNLQKIEEKLKSSFDDKLLEIREKARQLEVELLNEMKTKEARTESLAMENSKLRHHTKSLQAELSRVKSNLMPKEKLEEMLQGMVR